jgi:hypothetical protein
MRRRKFVALLGGLVAASPFGARAAQGDAGDRRPVRRFAQLIFGTIGRVPPGTKRSLADSG